MDTEVGAVIGVGGIGQAIARRQGPARSVVLADFQRRDARLGREGAGDAFGIHTTVNLDSSARSSSRSNPRTTPNRPSPTTTSAGGCSSSIGNHRTAGNPAIPRRSRERSSRLPARTRRH